MRTKIFAGLLAVTASVSLALFGAPVAQAASPAASQSVAGAAVVTVPAGQRSATLTVGGTTVTVVKPAHPSVAVLTCTVAPGNPFHGTAGVSSTVWAHCNSNAASLSFGTALYYDGASAAQNNAQVTNCTNCYVTVTAPYQAGQWKAGAILGYFDSTGNGEFTAEAYSSTVTL
jgi:hypothetical protein